MAAGIVTASVAIGPPAYACSKIPFSIWRARGVAHFVGSATSDTVLAGPGPVAFRSAPGHYGPGTARAIYGQVIDVERLGSAAPPALVNALPASARRVILVPRDYAADCHPVPWTKSVRWVEPAARGVFSATLRDSAHWVSGVPTLDVHEPYGMPHPSLNSARRTRPGGARSADSLLTPEQLLDLYDVLPEPSVMAARPDSAIAPLRRWTHNNPQLLTRIPADYIVRSVLWQAEAARVRATESPLAGTYRIVLRLPTGDTVPFFARTSIHPSSRLYRLTSGSVSHDREPTGFEAPPSLGYYLMAYVARSLDELPSGRTRELGDRQGYIAALFAPEVTSADSSVWQGSIDLIEHAARLVPPGELRSRIEEAHATMWSMLTSGELTFVPGRFVRRADNSVRYTMDAVRDGAQVLSMRGERIALDHLRER